MQPTEICSQPWCGRARLRRERPGEALELEIALGAQRVARQELGEAMNLPRAEGHINEREAGEDLVLHRLRPAAAHPDHARRVLALEPPRLAQVREQPVVGRLADRARVEEDQVGLRRARAPRRSRAPRASRACARSRARSSGSRTSSGGSALGMAAGSGVAHRCRLARSRARAASGLRAGRSADRRVGDLAVEAAPDEHRERALALGVGAAAPGGAGARARWPRRAPWRRRRPRAPPRSARRRCRRLEARADPLHAPAVDRPAILDQQPRVARVVEVALAGDVAIASSTAAGG